jgi:hypothetical protein
MRVCVWNVISSNCQNCYSPAQSGVYSANTHSAFNVLKNTNKLIENRFSRSKVIQISIYCVWERLTRRWDVWHWQWHCVFTTGGERVKKEIQIQIHWQNCKVGIYVQTDIFETIFMNLFLVSLIFIVAWTFFLLQSVNCLVSKLFIH